ncbi:hypothetical protein M9Y10_001521 [Tritrichomonas musculus]|uniref:DUF3447 domain-containing protein n=1 Tax=Tritrichomonas musculus TaxID=1915356 RepID=A0ABR2L773_9EUKA
MKSQVFIQEFITKYNQIEELLIPFFDDEKFNDENFGNIVSLFEKLKIRENNNELKSVLRLISAISRNHHRTPNFFGKIKRILNYFKEEIHQNFSNFEIFNIFSKDKRILLTLFEEKILIPDKTIVLLSSTREKHQQFDYPSYFSPEFQNGKEKVEADSQIFNEKREVGENDDYLCQLIRDDSLEEFITYSSQTNIQLSTTVKKSIFETNSFLLENQPSLIEYSAFFGSIQIMRYLQLNHVDLSPSLWLYAIHGRNPEMIHFLEENRVKPEDSTFKQCLIESIKCHHNDLSKYIKDNLLQNQEESSSHDVVLQCLKYYNFIYLQDEINEVSKIFYDTNVFYEFCKYDYCSIVQFLLSVQDLNIKSIII